MSSYLDLIVSQHRRPNFTATVEAVTSSLVGLQDLLEDMRRAFDLDTAIGVQLDQVGEWVGRSRLIETPLENVWFSWNVEGVGWNEGHWIGPYDPVMGMIVLTDEPYRLLLRAKIAANAWDGTRDTVYDIWEFLFAGTGLTVLFADHGDMSITVGVAGRPPDAVLAALLAGGYIPLKPASVAIRSYTVLPTGSAGPLFSWNCDTAALAGWGDGAWGRALYAI